MQTYSDRMRRLFDTIDQWQPLVEIWVPGLPATSGSKTAIPKQRADGSLYSIVMPANQRQKLWQSSVSLAASQAYMDPPRQHPTAIRLHCLFRFVRPNAHYKPNGGLKKEARPYPTYANLGDLTKLVRAVEDALIGIVFQDDSQVVEQSNGKCWGEQPGCLVRVFEAV